MGSTGLTGRIRRRYREVTAIAPRFKPLRAYSNWVLSNYERLTGASRIRARPLKLTIDPNNVCQLRCPLCPTGYQVLDRGKGHADLRVFEQLMDEIGDYLFFMDIYNWGEPLISPHLPEIISLADRKGITTHMSSNLSLRLTDERIERLLRSGLGTMNCSIDGATEETYSTYRRRGKFDLVLDNLRRIVEMRNRLGLSRPLIVWQFVVFRFNEHELELAAELGREIGVDRIQFIPPHLAQDRFPLTPEDSAAVNQWTPVNPAFNRFDPSHAEYKARHRKRHRRCDWHYVSAALNWDGTVAPCCSVFEKKDDFGVLDYQAGRTYMDVVNNERFTRVRDRFAGRIREPIDLVCENCPSPLEMTYADNINRRIVVTTAMQVAAKIASLLGAGPRLRHGEPGQSRA